MKQLSVQSLHELKTKSTGMESFSITEGDFCQPCCKAKSVNKTFKGNKEKAKKPYQTPVHVRGSLGGNANSNEYGSCYEIIYVKHEWIMQRVKDLYRISTTRACTNVDHLRG